MHRRLTVLTLTVLLGLASAFAAAQTEHTGQTASGAYYRIAVPDGWQPADGLAIWNHGFSFDPPGPVNDLGPLVDVQLAEGYAVAASSYSLNGWALFQTLRDLQEMYEVFVDEVGTPDEVLVTGASLGGAVTAQAIEGKGIGNVVGAFPICGALGGSRIWNSALDLRLLYDYVCADVPGAFIPGGALGLTDPTFNDFDLVLAVNACTGVSLPASARTATQQANLDRILGPLELPENFLLIDMGFAVFGIADLFFDPRKLGGVQALGNKYVDYGDAAVNDGIERVVADADGLKRFLDYYTPTGKVGATKIVSIHTDQDGLVLIENESEYAATVPKKSFTLGVVVEDVPSHCDFKGGAEVLSGWENLRAWVAGAPQPTAADLQVACQGIVAGGLAEGPCRFDVGFDVPDLNDRVRPRLACVPDATTLCLNDGRFRAQVTWEDGDGDTGVGQAATGQGTDDTGLFWFFGPQNLELMVKALDGRQRNGRFWIFYGSLTNVSFELTVTDSETGERVEYSNPMDNFGSVGDTEAF